MGDPKQRLAIARPAHPGPNRSGAAARPACSNGAGTYAKPPAPSPPYPQVVDVRGKWKRLFGTELWDGRSPASTTRRASAARPSQIQGNGTLARERASLQPSARSESFDRSP